MDFTHRPYVPGETIVAIATPPGEGGIAVIRISGEQALEVANKVFSRNVYSFQSHTAHFGIIRDASGAKVDEVLLLVMKGGRSYTGEDTVEIQCHGGSLITKKVFQVALDAGARAALPGEFTFKAFINGKLDLAQAEAVQKLIGARNHLALSAADSQLSGALSQKVKQFQKTLFGVAAILEAWVDFPEEGLEFASFEEVVESLEKCRSEMQNLADSFHEGSRIHDGFSLALIGAPNVGKSSLMNALLGKERAIVTEVAGTTRDVLEEELHLGNLHFKLIDTAGIRETDEVVEKEGIRRSHAAALSADVTLCVMDGTTSLDGEMRQLLERFCPNKIVVVWNKCDLNQFQKKPIDLPHQVTISAKERDGLDLLKKVVEKVVWSKGLPSKEEIVITTARHHSSLKNAIIALEKVKDGLNNGISAEFVSHDMRECLKELGHIVGTNVTEDLLSSIFSKFCVGK